MIKAESSLLSNIQEQSRMPISHRNLDRKFLRLRKAVWRLFNDYSPNSKAVFILGAQRSGTTMLTHCLNRSIEFAVYGEASEAMVNFRIKNDEVVREMIISSRHKFTVFKPLTDSHRARDFLSLTPNTAAIWMYRGAEDRANSAVEKSGSHNLEVLKDFVNGEGGERYQLQGLTDEDRDFVKQHDCNSMSRHDAAALVWYLRNSLFFKQRLGEMDNVLPVAYEDLVTDPRRIMSGVCRFLGATFHDDLIRGIHSKSLGKSESRLTEEMAALSITMYHQLHDITESNWSRFGV